MSVSVPGGLSYNFSSPGHNPVLRYPQRWPSSSNKTKNPSQQRRDRRRWEAFQAKKAESSGQPPPEERSHSSHPPTTGVVSGLQEQQPVKPESSPASVIVESSESIPVSNPSVNDMEVESLPSAISPTSSTKRPKLDVKPPIPPPSQVSSDEQIQNDLVLLSEWPEDLSKVLNGPKSCNRDFTILTLIASKNDISASASLNRTLKKCNLRSFDPTLVRRPHSQESKYVFFKFNVQGKHIKRTLLNLRSNWMSVENSRLEGFQIPPYKFFFLND